MSSIRNITASTAVPDDLAKRLGPSGVNEILLTLWQGYRRRRDTNAYYAAMYLLTSNDDIYRRTVNCFCKDGIEFGYAVLKNTSPHNYALFMAARDLCDKTEAVTMADLAEPEVIDPEALRLIVNATLIARYGLAAFQIRARGAEYER